MSLSKEAQERWKESYKKNRTMSQFPDTQAIFADALRYAAEICDPSKMLSPEQCRDAILKQVNDK